MDITKNIKIETYEDCKNLLTSMLEPLLPYYSEGKANIDLGCSGYHYTKRAGKMQTFSRILWGIGPFVKGGGNHKAVLYAIEGLKNGTNPNHEDYWGEITDYQLIVEMAAIAYCILLKKEVFWDGLSGQEQINLYNWLNQVNKAKLNNNNWQFFRVIVNLAFEKTGMDFDKKIQEESLETIDKAYKGEGWFQDGTNGAFDYYNQFAFHFYSMVYYMVKKDEDKIRCEKYKEYAIEFAKHVIYWVSDSGEMVPYGRSLGYRFAMISSFVGAAMAGIEVVPWGVLKHIVLNHLRYWFSKPIFNSDGILNIGYTYPNNVTAEEYMAPGSPYWCFKIFGILALDKSSTFWSAKEANYNFKNDLDVEKIPGFLVKRNDNGRHIVLYSGKQNKGDGLSYTLSTFSSLYGKFAYSSLFGVSVSRNNYNLSQGAYDSTLAIKKEEDEFYHIRMKQELIDINKKYIHSRWSLYKNVVIDTVIVPLNGGHIRIHRIQNEDVLETAEGGFSIEAMDYYNKTVLTKERIDIFSDRHISIINNLSLLERKPVSVKAESCTNLMFGQTVIPMLTCKINPGVNYLISSVFAGYIEDSNNWEMDKNYKDIINKLIKKIFGE